MARPPLLLLAALLTSAACGGSQNPNVNPLQPSATPPATPSGSSNATPIILGQTIAGTVNLSDPPCDTQFLTDASDPCQRFAITPSTSGALRVHVSSPGPGWLALRVGGIKTYGVTIVDGAASVNAGATYEVSVAAHAGNRRVKRSNYQRPWTPGD